MRLRGIESGFAKQVSYHVDKDLSASCVVRKCTYALLESDQKKIRKTKRAIR